tara:strand:+ start:288 stop:854 length:567 start_codon:yes stop_codon:yes gene_type:complete
VALTKVRPAGITDMGMVKLATVSSTSAVSSVDISVDYSTYTNFRLIMNIVGDSSSGIDGRITWKRAGESSFDTGAVYGAQAVLLDADNNHVNQNGTATHLYFTGNPQQAANRGFQCDLFFGGIGSSSIPSAMHGITTLTSLQADAVSSFALGGSYDNATNARERITAMQVSFSTGNISEIHYTLYGMG